MEYTDFPIELHTDIDGDEYDNYFQMIDEELRDLAKGHKDIVSASVRLETPTEGRETPPVYEATITAHVRPNDIVATEKADDPEGALRGALRAVERQVREKRDRLKNY